MGARRTSQLNTAARSHSTSRYTLAWETPMYLSYKQRLSAREKDVANELELAKAALERSRVEASDPTKDAVQAAKAEAAYLRQLCRIERLNSKRLELKFQMVNQRLENAEVALENYNEIWAALDANFASFSKNRDMRPEKQHERLNQIADSLRTSLESTILAEADKMFAQAADRVPERESFLQELKSFDRPSLDGLAEFALASPKRANAPTRRITPKRRAGKRKT